VRDAVPQLLRRNADVHGDVAAVITEARAITHGELDARSRALAARLVAAGVGRAARVGLLAPNGVDWVVKAMAATRIGATLVPLSTLARPAELADLLHTAAVTHLVAAETFKGRRYLDEVAGIGRDVPSLRATWSIDALPEAAVAPALVDALEAAVRPADDLVVLFTSGSTGTPKGTIHTHGGALGASAANLDARRLGPGERLYMPMPFFWTGGFATALVSTLVAGATLLTEAEPEPARTLAFLERERVTLFRGWPDQAAALAAHPALATTDLSGLGDASLAAVLPTDRRPAPGTRPNIFGMTETFGPWCGDRLDVDLPPAKHGSCGRPLPGVEVRVVDGQLQLRGPNLFRTYVGRERREVFTADGWFATGDRGRIDDDGYVWFEGRSDDMFKVKGATVYPVEVEAALRSIEVVRQAHVTEVDGEVGAAVVTALDADVLRIAVKERLSAFKVPTRWLVVADLDQIPLTATGKVDKRALRARLEEAAP
jgi:acyl-CoA synthetase (AMP-forming)/AMP-acid ligase II